MSSSKAATGTSPSPPDRNNNTLLAQLQQSSVTERSAAIQTLRERFDKNNNSVDWSYLKDDSLHKLLEALFQFSLLEKDSFLGRRSKKPVASSGPRLSNCAATLKSIAENAAPKLTRKTVLAMIDHITQTLPGPNGALLEPLEADYLKALIAVLSYPAHVEHISTRGSRGWETCVDFSTKYILRYFRTGDDTPEHQSSTPRRSQRPAQHTALSRRTLQDLLVCLGHLVLAPNAPLVRRMAEISSVVIRVIHAPELTDNEAMPGIFAILKPIIRLAQTERISVVNGFMKDLVPLMCRWWQSSKAATDSLVSSQRGQLSELIILCYPHLEYLLQTAHEDLRKDLDNLLDVIWNDYAKRYEESILQLDDLAFGLRPLPKFYLHTSLFALRPHSTGKERIWAVPETISILEDLLWRSSKRERRLSSTEGQPRKRMRTGHDNSRIRTRLKSENINDRIAALQAICFVVSRDVLGEDELFDLSPDIVSTMNHKRGEIASWAILACASYGLRKETTGAAWTDHWRQAWHLAARTISLPGTSRASCVLLHVILSMRLLPYHNVSEDIDTIMTQMGPALLVDSSLQLMLRMLQIRNAKAPSASQAARNNIIRWIFSKWSPDELPFAQQCAIHLRTPDLFSLLGACCGADNSANAAVEFFPGGAISHITDFRAETSDMTNYVMLLDDHDANSLKNRYQEGLETGKSDASRATQSGSFDSSKRLIVELLCPKLEDLEEMCRSWVRNPGESAKAIAPVRLQSLLLVCLTAAKLVPHLADLHMRQSDNITQLVTGLIDSTIQSVVGDVTNSQALLDLLLMILSPCLPQMTAAGLESYVSGEVALLPLLSKVSGAMRGHAYAHGLAQDTETTQLHDEFESQANFGSAESKKSVMPRRQRALALDPVSFSANTKLRLQLVQILHEDPSQCGLIPQPFVDHLLALSDEEFLSCQQFLTEILESDLVLSPDDAARILGRVAGIIGESEFYCCEVALCTCLGLLRVLDRVWVHDDQELGKMVGDLYYHFLKSLKNNYLSPRTQSELSELMLMLMREKPEYGNDLDHPSCRTILLASILRDGRLVVKYSIAAKIADVFGSFVLKAHDDVFVDVLDSLPTDPADFEGMALRLFVLSRLACRWPTLLRRCTYHIFETPARTGLFTEHATRCVSDIYAAVQLKTPQDLFGLFAPQLLFTWLESDSVENVPYSIFGFESLAEILRSAQAEIIALSIMRGQEDGASQLARILNVDLQQIVQDGFARLLAHAIAHDTSVTTANRTKGEEWIRKLLGKEPFMDAVYLNFVDIVAMFFQLMDHENEIEKYFARDESLGYAAQAMTDIKALSHSSVVLPQNQQPSFRGKYLVNQLLHLCQKTEYQFGELWTPALVVFVARRLLSTIHRSLGSLHACSVLRKIRILICLAGPTAYESYPLEMLLHSLRPLIVDSECADDALGISQYLLAQGLEHLRHVPAFVAGYSLSTLASLRVFLESRQASTTQESQFKATMSKTQRFHTWFGQYLHNFDSPAFQDDSQRAAFRSITQSSSHIRSSGNATKGTDESSLLLEVLRDGEREDRLLDDVSTELAMKMLCGDFAMPPSCQHDVVDTDDGAREYAASVAKSCRAKGLSSSYLAWAGRLVGRAFAASGDVPLDLLRESNLQQYLRIAPEPYGSEKGLLHLLQGLCSHQDCQTADLAESALRTIVSYAVLKKDELLTQACAKTLAESLYQSSEWGQYHRPPSEAPKPAAEVDRRVFHRDAICDKDFVPRLVLSLLHSASQTILLSVMGSVVTTVREFVLQAFPFLVHLVLASQLDAQPVVKRALSSAINDWCSVDSADAKENIKHLINTLLYLRTQLYPNEGSIADRTKWLDVNYSVLAAAASRCGMYKTALVFAEMVPPPPLPAKETRSSRQSSSSLPGPWVVEHAELLLAVFEHVDDPDAYYGIVEESSLSSVIARLDYENNGTQSLAFRGAQYDNRIRLGDAQADHDGRALVRALSSLGLSALSHAVLQTQQTLDTTPASIANTFDTARKLEIWNLPVPPAPEHNNPVLLYQTYQLLLRAPDMTAARHAVSDGLARLMRTLASGNRKASETRHQLVALASLAELDSILDVAGLADLEEVLARFDLRNEWMRSGRYEDVCNMLSCRGTTLRMLSRQGPLRAHAKISTVEAKQVEIKGLLMASKTYRLQQATQESLNISTALNDAITPCQALGLAVDAAIRIEVANSLWDHGEMTSSIRMLQAIKLDSSLDAQAIPVRRSDLLSKIGYQVSVAKLEKPQDIQRTYLDPALKELKQEREGKEAGQVFHQFAMFCDEQLQSQDGLEDLARLQSLRKSKLEEVAKLKALLADARDEAGRHRVSSHLVRAQQWLELDEKELRRVEQTRTEFVHLCLENYLLALTASEDHNNDALRFTALWLERAEQRSTHEPVKRQLGKVPTRKFVLLMNQLTSRVQEEQKSESGSVAFQSLLSELIFRICSDHPYHGLYHIWSGLHTKVTSRDPIAAKRQKATERISKHLLAPQAASSKIWQAVRQTSKAYYQLAVEKDANRYKAGARIPLKDSSAASNLIGLLTHYRIPPPTMQLALAADKDYGSVPIIMKLESTMSIASGISSPKILTAVGSNGRRYKQLVKGGSDDLRQDAIMEQVFAAVSSLLKSHRATQQRNLKIRTYKVLPLTANSGLIEFVANTVPLQDWLVPAHQRYYPKDLTGAGCRKEIAAVQSRSNETRINVYRTLTDKFHPVMRYFFVEYFVDPDDWFMRRLAYTRSTAAISMLGHILGVGDRHGHNILLDTRTGEIVHIDLGIAFEMGRVLPVPEVVPFRLTRDIVDGMGITETEGVFRRCCEFTLEALRDETYSIMTILDVLRYDPLYSWSISPLRLATLQRPADEPSGGGGGGGGEGDGAVGEAAADSGRPRKKANEAAEAHRALEVVRQKLSKTLSVTATVNDLINQARDERNLALLYCGWGAYA